MRSIAPMGIAFRSVPAVPRPTDLLTWMSALPVASLSVHQDKHLVRSHPSQRRGAQGVRPVDLSKSLRN